jgi:uncharacterized caspase-like protein
MPISWKATTTAAVVALALIPGTGRNVAAQTKRALVVGIDQYEAPKAQLDAWHAEVAPVVAAWQASVGAAVAASAASEGRAMVPDLDGAVNDARSMAATLKSPKYAFTDVRILVDAEATRAGVLAAIERLIQDTRPGDVIVFFYAGHGSQRVNSLADVKLNHLDQTIVPADANAGQFDIRNTELAALFDRLIDKGASLTLIFDSCHSGSITRGETAPTKKRWAQADPRDAHNAVRPVPPETRGALFIAAAADFETAEETIDQFDQKSHGVFTSALLQVMRQSRAAAPAADIFASARAVLLRNGLAQHPVLRNEGRERGRPLFGPASELAAGDGVSLAVVRVGRDTVGLQGGAELGIGRGTELKLADSARGKSLRLRVVNVSGMGLSTALPSSGQLNSLKAGDLLVIDKWVESDRPALRVWIPATLNASALNAARSSFAALRHASALDWVDDPSTIPDDGRPLYVVRYSAQGWRLQGPSAAVVSLPSPTAAAVEQAVAAQEATAAKSATVPGVAPATRGRPRVFVMLPPTPVARSLVNVGAGTENTAIAIDTSMRSADYLLVGRDSAGHVAYAWLRPNARVTDDRRSLPTRSDWFAWTPASDTTVGASLESRVLSLAKVNGWLTIESPDDPSSFPYRLYLRNVATGEVKDSGVTRHGERYEFLLRRDLSVSRNRIETRWVYIFAIDSWGRGTPLWAADNTIPPDSAGRKLVPDSLLLRPNRLSSGRVEILPPYGTDTFVLISSDQPLDPAIFKFDAVQTRGPGLVPDNQTPLERLFTRLGGQRRGVVDGIPVSWSIQRVPLKSVETP